MSTLYTALYTSKAKAMKYWPCQHTLALKTAPMSILCGFLFLISCSMSFWSLNDWYRT